MVRNVFVVSGFWTLNLETRVFENPVGTLGPLRAHRTNNLTSPSQLLACCHQTSPTRRRSGIFFGWIQHSLRRL